MLQLKIGLPSATAVKGKPSQQEGGIQMYFVDLEPGKGQFLVPSRQNFGTSSGFPIGIRTCPGRISQRYRVVAELIGETSLATEAADALRG